MLATPRQPRPGLAVALAACAALAAPATAQTIGGRWQVAHDIVGPRPAAHTGQSAAGLGDVDGDGSGDFVIGSIGFVVVYSGRDGATIRRFDGTPELPDLGVAVAAAGDVDRDGVTDLVVGASHASPGGRFHAGSALVFSGADGSTLWRFDGAVAGGKLGAAVAGAGDVDGDGCADVIVGAPAPWASLPGSATVFSGADGTVLWRFDGVAVGDQLGASVDGAGDVDRDGQDDVIVGAPFADPGGRLDAGSAQVFSGRSGNVLWSFEGAAGDALGRSVAGAADTDGDGFDDVIVGAPQDGTALGEGFARVFSGRTGAMSWQGVGPFWRSRFGAGVAACGDVNADGCPDVAVGAPQASPGGRALAGSAFVLSGRDGGLLQRFDGAQPGDESGLPVAGVGDMDADGFAEVVVGAPLATRASQLRAGYATVHRLDPFVTPSAFEVSASRGGVVSYEIAFPPQAAGHEFILLMSLSGTGPIQLGVPIPLGFDLLLVHSFFGSLGAPFTQSGFRGTLSATGHAPGPALFGFPAGFLTGASGARLHLAAIGYARGSLPTYSSVAVRLDVVP